MNIEYKLIEIDSLFYNKLYNFLKKIDKSFPIPISDKTDFDVFLKKIKSKGLVYCAFDKELVIGACFFYCNDDNTKTAFLTLLGVLDKYKKNGVGSNLVDLMIRYCKSKKYSRIRLYTRENNFGAIRLYLKNGFYTVKSDRKNDLMLELKI